MRFVRSRCRVSTVVPYLSRCCRWQTKSRNAPCWGVTAGEEYRMAAASCQDPFFVWSSSAAKKTVPASKAATCPRTSTSIAATYAETTRTVLKSGSPPGDPA